MPDSKKVYLSMRKRTLELLSQILDRTVYSTTSDIENHHRQIDSFITQLNDRLIQQNEMLTKCLYKNCGFKNIQHFQIVVYMVKSNDNRGWKIKNKQPNYTILFIFVFKLAFIDCVLFKVVGFDQLWTEFKQKLATDNRKLVFFKMPNTFCRFALRNCCYFLPCKFQFIYSTTYVLIFVIPGICYAAHNLFWKGFLLP